MWKFELVDFMSSFNPRQEVIYTEDRETEESDGSKSFLYRLMICTSGIISDYVVSAVRFKLNMRISKLDNLIAIKNFAATLRCDKQREKSIQKIDYLL